MQLLSQSTHRQSFIGKLNQDIREQANSESLAFHTAATRVLLQWLRYELDDVTFIDANDRGIDAWLVTDAAGFQATRRFCTSKCFQGNLAE